MLITFGQFENRQAIRNSAQLLQPRTVLLENLMMPRDAVIHHLDFSKESSFPNRELPQLAGTPSKKRIPIQHITDLTSKTEVGVIQNRYVDKDIREWMRGNMDQWRVWDLLTTPNPDTTVNAVINYNHLVGLYKYKPNLLTAYNQRFDLLKTYWQTVAAAAQVSPNHYQFVKVKVPKAIPSRNLLDKIVAMPAVRMSRILNTDALFSLTQLYMYLNPATRAKSALADVPQDITSRIVVEFNYDEYSVFCKLSHLVSLLKDSPLENKLKLPVARVQQVFLLMMLRTQSIVEEKRNGQNSTLLLQDQEDAKQLQSAVLPDETNEDDSGSETQRPPQDTVPGGNISQLQSSLIPKQSAPHLPLPASNLKDNAFFDVPEMPDNWDTKLDEDLSEYEGTSDMFFSKVVQQVSTLPETVETEPDADSGDDQTQTALDIHAVDRNPERIAQLLRTPTVQEKLETYIQEAKGYDALSTAEARVLRKTFEKRQQMSSPYNPSVKIDEYKQVTPEDLQLPDFKLPIKNDLVPESHKQERLFNIDKKYIRTTLRKHLLACVTSLESNDLIIKDYQVEEIKQSIGRYEVHKVTFKPLRGKESSVYFRIPVINDEGEFTAGNVTYRMRRQKSQIPICKVSPIKVAVTSNYNKLFIGRSERKAFDPYANIATQIKTDYLEVKGNITKIEPANRFDNLLKLPNMYAAMSQHFNSVVTPEYHLYFNHAEIGNHIDEKVLKDLQSKNLTFIGHNRQSQILVMDSTEAVFNYSAGMQPLPPFSEMLGLDSTKIPQAFSSIKILGDNIPLGVMLGYYLGFKDLVAVTGAQMTVHPRGARIASNSNKDVVLRFGDAKVLVQCPDTQTTLLFAGYNFYANYIKTQTLESFYSQNVYLDLLESRDAGLMHLKEMDSLRSSFIDPITKDALISINEPTEFLPLMLRANEMLADFHHLDVNDPTNARIRGYDRVPGLVYRALSESVREHRMRGGKGKIELDPFKVWKYVTQDTTVKVTEDNNPITDVKETESVTFSGQDGLSRTATPEALRRYHPKDRQLVSEATVDSSDVALNLYLSPYAKIKNLLGDVDVQADESDTSPEKIFSTSMQLVPMSEFDD